MMKDGVAGSAAGKANAGNTKLPRESTAVMVVKGCMDVGLGWWDTVVW